ncbi:hypothetical protein DCCM_0495 [Desulfocucumis palustris]|uniref:Uncharacterized protein n=1 Tax=Desulfocucumis palustris TaxID=1898651 RepID=A0A2L2XEQ1_9FIRM|nr:hypothetical protein [Desulfocucumis palustris]GBF32301.1 hypothetical protein DCCM_0495 [Desulfocucumis palustris]
MLRILLFFVQGFPESIGICAFSLALARVKLRWGIILPAAFVMTAIILALRSMPITFGLHTVASILLLALFIAMSTRVPPSKCFLVVFASFDMLVLLEYTILEEAVRLLNTDVNDLMSNAFLWKLTTLPQAILMIIFALLFSKYRKPLKDLWRI